MLKESMYQHTKLRYRDRLTRLVLSKTNIEKHPTTQKIKNRGLAKMLKSLLIMVVEAKNVRIWKPENQAIRVSSARVISWISQKKEFSRGAMEKALCLTLAQAEWWVKELVKKGIIKRTSKKAPKIFGISKQQVIYKYIK